MIKKSGEHQKNLIIIATGGTGGHVFTAQAIIETLEKTSNMVWVFTDYKSRKKAYWEGYSTRGIISGKISGIPWYKKIMNTCFLSMGIVQSIVYFIKNRPQLVVGFGSYASLPPLIAAIFLRIPIIIHEQNAIMGRVNSLMSPWAKRVALSLPMEKTVKRSRVVGLPIRNAFKDIRKDFQYPLAKKVYTKENPMKVFIVGGSQGAKIFSSTLPKAFGLLPKNIQESISVAQQCRSELIVWTQNMWQETHVHFSLQAFYTDISKQMQSADIIIARAGASTIAELLCIGKAALYVPFAKAIGNHQAKNAQALVKKGAGWMLTEKECTPQKVADFIKDIWEGKIDSDINRKKAYDLGNPDADKQLEMLIQEVINERKEGK